MKMPKALQAIIEQYPEEWAHFIDGDEIAYASMLYQPLYEYFSSIGEMPYGDVWITRRMMRYV